MSKVKYTLAKVTRRGRRPSVFKTHVPKKPRKNKVIKEVAEKSGLSYEETLSIAHALACAIIDNMVFKDL